MSKTKDNGRRNEHLLETYKKEREPRTHRRKIEEERIKEVKIPSRNQLNAEDLINDEGGTI